jgi:hypothetical protein
MKVTKRRSQALQKSSVSVTLSNVVVVMYSAMCGAVWERFKAVSDHMLSILVFIKSSKAFEMESRIQILLKKISIVFGNCDFVRFEFVCEERNFFETNGFEIAHFGS